MAGLNITRDSASLKNFKAVKLILRGRIDTITAKDLRDALREINDGEAVVLDFKGVSYIASSGLREILIAAKRLGNDLIKLENVTPEVDDILKTSGFNTFINYTLKEPEAEQNNFKFNIQEMSLNDLL
ncbi:MAG: STAS domain-containing protein, partial [Synergistaceae bacterium]|nr:STAS domain-containing protein [Synergistaceae bacterium]